MGPVAGGAASTPPGPGPAAVGCAFGRLRSSASQAKRPHPCKLGRRLLVCAVLRTRQDRGWASCPTRPRHASGPWRSRPRNRTHPAYDRSPRSAVDPRHAWMNLHRNRIFRIGIEKHPRMAWIYRVDQGRHLPAAAGIRQRRGGVGVRGVSRMGPRRASGGLVRTPNPGLAVCAEKRTRASGCQAYRDVLAASPHSDTTPPSHGMPAFDVEVDVDSAGAGLQALPQRTYRTCSCLRTIAIAISSDCS